VLTAGSGTHRRTSLKVAEAIPRLHQVVVPLVHVGGAKFLKLTVEGIAGLAEELRPGGFATFSCEQITCSLKASEMEAGKLTPSARTRINRPKLAEGTAPRSYSIE
jgi:hypothetical protein